MSYPREMRDRARAMRREPTPAERTMWSLLRGGRLAGLKFRRQMPVGDYIADFACHDPKVIVECDGGQHADSDYDAARDSWFRSQGFKVLRFWNGEVIERPLGVAEAILRAIGRGRRDPSSSHSASLHGPLLLPQGEKVSHANPLTKI